MLSSTKIWFTKGYTIQYKGENPRDLNNLVISFRIIFIYNIYIWLYRDIVHFVRDNRILYISQKNKITKYLL